jgi:hypothetical protein
MLSSFPRKDAAAKVARREHVKVALIVVSSPKYFGKDFEHRKEKKREREREREMCVQCVRLLGEFVYKRILAEFNWPKIAHFLVQNSEAFLVCFPAACDIFNTHASSFIKTTHKNTHVFFDESVVFESDVDENDDERLLLFVSFERRRRENDDEEKAQEFRHFL